MNRTEPPHKPEIALFLRCTLTTSALLHSCLHSRELCPQLFDHSHETVEILCSLGSANAALASDHQISTLVDLEVQECDGFVFPVLCSRPGTRAGCCQGRSFSKVELGKLLLFFFCSGPRPSPTAKQSPSHIGQLSVSLPNTGFLGCGTVCLCSLSIATGHSTATTRSLGAMQTTRPVRRRGALPQSWSPRTQLAPAWL